MGRFTNEEDKIQIVDSIMGMISGAYQKDSTAYKMVRSAFLDRISYTNLQLMKEMVETAMPDRVSRKGKRKRGEK